MKLSVLEPLGIDGAKLKGMLEKAGQGTLEVICYPDRVEDSAALIERCSDADAVILTNFQFKREVIEKCGKLKLICVAFTGVDHVALDCCRERGIAVCNCAGYSTVAVAELVFGLLFALYRNIIPCDAAARSGGTKAGLIGCELAGKRFGVVGTGAIGLRVAELARAFGCEVYAYSRTERKDAKLRYVTLDELLSTCDIVSLHVPQTPETIGLIGAKQLALMNKSAVLINTARGPVVDSAALADALKSGVIAGAAVDVFETEPPIPSEHPLLSAPNLIATPHVAFATRESMEKRAVIVAENIACWVAEKPQNLV